MMSTRSSVLRITSPGNNERDDHQTFEALSCLACCLWCHRGLFDSTHFAVTQRNLQKSCRKHLHRKSISVLSHALPFNSGAIPGACALMRWSADGLTLCLSMVAVASMRLTTPVLPAALCSPAHPCDHPYKPCSFQDSTDSIPKALNSWACPHASVTALRWLHSLYLARDWL